MEKINLVMKKMKKVLKMFKFEKFEGVYGIVNLSSGIYDNNGQWRNAIAGFVVLVTDSFWGKDFRSTEKWQLLIYKREKDAGQVLPAFIFPGCRIAGVQIFATKDEVNFKKQMSNVLSVVE